MTKLEWAYPEVSPGIEPLGGRVLVQLKRIKKTTESGLVLVNETRDQEKWNTEIPPEEVRAKGICGSGIIDIVPQLFLAGIIDKTGKFKQDLKTPRLHEADGMMEYDIAWAKETSIGQDIVISQDDIRAVQLAKAAMYAGSKILMKTLGANKLDKVIWRVLLPDAPWRIFRFIPSSSILDYLHIPDLQIPQMSLEKGDERSLSIAAASVLAKTARDAHLIELDWTYPGDGFAHNMGYGTPRHLAALQRLGACAIHRYTFKPISQLRSLEPIPFVEDIDYSQ